MTCRANHHSNERNCQSDAARHCDSSDPAELEFARSLGDDPASHAAFARFVQLTEKSLADYFARRLNYRSDVVDDLVQQTYLSTFESRAQCRPGKALPFLYIKASNRLADYFRQLNRQLSHEGHLRDEATARAKNNSMPDIDGILQVREALERLSHETTELPEILHMRFWCGMTLEEIEQRTQFSKQHVSRKLRDALAQVSKYLGT